VIDGVGEQGKPGVGSLDGRLRDGSDVNGGVVSLGDRSHLASMLAERAAARVALRRRVLMDLRDFRGAVRLVAGGMLGFPLLVRRLARVRSRQEAEAENGEQQQSKEVPNHEFRWGR
jgi:hypothetical protein